MTSNLHKLRIRACRRAVMQALMKHRDKSLANEDLRCESRKFLADITLNEVRYAAQALTRAGLVGSVLVQWHNVYRAAGIFTGDQIDNMGARESGAP